jgi:hypothetical protein
MQSQRWSQLYNPNSITKKYECHVCKNEFIWHAQVWISQHSYESLGTPCHDHHGFEMVKHR